MPVLKVYDGTAFQEIPGASATAVIAASVLVDDALIRGNDGARGVQDSSASISDTGVLSVPGIGDGGLTSYDLKVGDVTTPDYGMIRMGDAVIGRTSYSVGAINLDGAILVRNIGGPVTGDIEFIVTESVGNTCRFALPKSGVGLATYNPRSMLIAGPAPADTDFVKVSYWQGTGIFDNLVCDTAGSGADLGVQNDLEVEGNIFVDTITESTVAAGVTIESVLLEDGDVSGVVDLSMTGDLTLVNAVGVDREDGPEIHLFRRDSSVGGGALVGAINFRGEEGSAPESVVGRIRVEAASVWSPSSSPTIMRFGITASSSTSQVDAMQLDGAGRLLIFGKLAVVAEIANSQVSIDGTTDVVQLRVQALLNQTSDVFVVENSVGTTLMSVDNNGSVFLGGLNSTSQTKHSIAGAVEMSLTANNLTFNNGAVDTGFEWPLSGVLGVTVGGVNKATFTSAGLDVGLTVRGEVFIADKASGLSGVAGTITYTGGSALTSVAGTALTGEMGLKTGPASPRVAAWVETYRGTTKMYSPLYV